MLNRDRDIYTLLVVCDNAGLRVPSSTHHWTMDHYVDHSRSIKERWPYGVVSHRVPSGNLTVIKNGHRNSGCIH